MSGSSAPTWNLLRGLPDDPAALQRLRQASIEECRARVEAAGVHLGPEATDRAYELVAMGLLYEENLWARAFREQAKARRKRGRPPKTILKDEERADFLLRLKAGGYTEDRLEDWVNLVAPEEKRWIGDDPRRKENCLFAYGATTESLVESVSRGLKMLGLTADALVK